MVQQKKKAIKDPEPLSLLGHCEGTSGECLVSPGLLPYMAFAE